MSLAKPRAGLAVTPEFPSEPPQFSPSTISLAGIGSRRTSLTSRQHGRDLAQRRLDRFRRAAAILDREHGRQLPWRRAKLHQSTMLDQVRQRGRLAAQADQQEAADVGMPSKPGQDARELLMVLAAVLQAAAPLVHQRQDAVHVGKVGQQCPIEPLGDVLACRGRAIHGRDHGQVVARGGLAVGPAIALEGATGDRLGRGRHFGGVLVIAR